MTRESFAVRFSALGNAGYEVHVTSPAGEATAILDLSELAWLLKRAARAIPADEPDWRATGFDALMSEVEAAKREMVRWDPVEIGSALYRALFTPPIQRLFDRSRGLAVSQGDTLPIELRFAHSSPHQARLASLPWELLHDPPTATFLAQRDATPITRYLAFEGRVRRLRAPTVWRILIVAASPSDLASIDLEKELEALSTWPQANIVVDRLVQPNRQRVNDAIRSGGYHILHFLGHGSYDAEVGEGSIALVDDNGESDWLSGPELAEWIVNEHGLRLVVLNACSTGEVAGAEPFAGVATALVRNGVPSALAMRRAIPGDHALAFARVLYGRLSRGRPIDAALSSARSELATLEPESDHWATPLLFTHTNDVFHIPRKMRETLTRMFSWLGVTSAAIAFNAWSGSQGGPQIPGLDFNEVHEQTVPIYGVLFVAPLVIPLLLILLRFQRMTTDLGLLNRIPSPFNLPVGDSRSLARIYKSVMLFIFVGVPALSQIHFQREILWRPAFSVKDSTKEYASNPRQHLLRPEPLSVLGGHNYYFGPQKIADGKGGWLRNPDCAALGVSVCDVTFFPFWQPWMFLVLDFWIWILTIAVLWGVWAREPLFRILARTLRRLRTSTGR